MPFKVIKSSFDGICGAGATYATIDEVLPEVSYHKGWDSVQQLHVAIRKWADNARPGSVFCTQVTAVVCVGVDRYDRDDDVCHHCDYEEGLDYGDIGGVEGGDLEQKVSCPSCEREWIDVFVLAEQRELVSSKKKR